MAGPGGQPWNPWPVMTRPGQGKRPLARGAEVSGDQAEGWSGARGHVSLSHLAALRMRTACPSAAPVSTVSPGPPWVWAAWHHPCGSWGAASASSWGRAVRLGSQRLGADACGPFCLQPPEDLRAGGDGAALWVRGLQGLGCGGQGWGYRGAGAGRGVPMAPGSRQAHLTWGVGAITAAGRAGGEAQRDPGPERVVPPPPGTWPWCPPWPRGPTGCSSRRRPPRTAGRTSCARGWAR